VNAGVERGVLDLAAGRLGLGRLERLPRRPFGRREGGALAALDRPRLA